MPQRARHEHVLVHARARARRAQRRTRARPGAEAPPHARARPRKRLRARARRAQRRTRARPGAEAPPHARVRPRKRLLVLQRRTSRRESRDAQMLARAGGQRATRQVTARCRAPTRARGQSVRRVASPRVLVRRARVSAPAGSAAQKTTLPSLRLLGLTTPRPPTERRVGATASPSWTSRTSSAPSPSSSTPSTAQRGPRASERRRQKTPWRPAVRAERGAREPLTGATAPPPPAVELVTAAQQRPRAEEGGGRGSVFVLVANPANDAHPLRSSADAADRSGSPRRAAEARGERR